MLKRRKTGRELSWGERRKLETFQGSLGWTKDPQGGGGFADKEPERPLKGAVFCYIAVIIFLGCKFQAAAILGGGTGRACIWRPSTSYWYYIPYY